MALSTTTGSVNGSWSILFASYRKDGYTPVAYNLTYSNSLSVVVGVETFDVNSIAGFCNASNVTVKISVLFMKV